VKRPKTAAYAAGTASLLAWLAACGSAGHAVAAHNTQSWTPTETASPVASPATQATDIPILHEGTTVKLPYVTEMAGTQGAQVSRTPLGS